MIALVIVHISTLDAYASQKGVKAAYDLASNWRREVLSWKGPIVVVDQKWPYDPDLSEPRYNFVKRVQLARDIMFVEQRDVDELDEILLEVSKELKKLDVNEVSLGGLWYGGTGEFGAVAEAANFFKNQGFGVSIDKALIAHTPYGYSRKGRK